MTVTNSLGKTEQEKLRAEQQRAQMMDLIRQHTKLYNGLDLQRPMVAATSVGGGAGGTTNNAKFKRAQPTPPEESTSWRRDALWQRLRLHPRDEPFEHFNTGLTNDKVYLFLIYKKSPVMLEDDRAMYPSDALITQLRLLIG